MTTRGGDAAGLTAAGAGGAGVGVGDSEAAAGAESVPELGGCPIDFCGKRGIVFAAGAPAAAAGREAPSGPDAGRVRLGIGFVTAADQAGGTFWTGAGVKFAFGPSGSVVAPETLGRGESCVAVGLAGRGGRLMRRVSRFGGGELEPSGVGSAGSAISRAFYRYFRKYSMAKLLMTTSFCIRAVSKNNRCFEKS